MISSYATFRHDLENYNRQIEKVNNEEKIKSEFQDFINKILDDLRYKSGNIKLKNHSISCDGAIYDSQDNVLAIFEFKSPNSPEMLKHNNFEKKALFELVYYYLQFIRFASANTLKWLFISDGFRFYLFKEELFRHLFYKPELLNFMFKGELTPAGNMLFKPARPQHTEVYNLISSYFKKNKLSETFNKYPEQYWFFTATDENFFDFFHPSRLKDIPLIQPVRFNTQFYKEFLYILGLKEIVKNKHINIVVNKQVKGTLIEQIFRRINDDINHNSTFYDALSILILWVNRILFLKIYEKILINFNSKNHNRYYILSEDKCKNFQDLEYIFFEVLAKHPADRQFLDKSNFCNIPFVNSSLFEIQDK